MARRTKTSSEGEGEKEIPLRRIITRLMTIPPDRYGEALQLLAEIDSPDAQQAAAALRLYYDALGVLEDRCTRPESRAGKAN